MSTMDPPTGADPQNVSHGSPHDGLEKIVVVIDSDAETREALADLLDSPDRMIQPYSSADEFLASDFVHNRPTCIVSEVKLPTLNGLALQERLQNEGCRFPIIFLSRSNEISLAVQAMRGGAFDYLERPVRRALLLERIDLALDEDARQLLEDRTRREFEKVVVSLSRRQREVYQLLIQGKSNKQIAAELQIGLPTVTRHRATVLAHFGVPNLVRLLVRVASLETRSAIARWRPPFETADSA